MEEKNNTNSILNQFKKSAEEFSNQTNALSCVMKSNTDFEEKSLKWQTASIYYNSFVIEFRYNAHIELSMVNSILSAYVRFGKDDNSLAYPLSFLMGYFNSKALEIPELALITNKSGMEQAFEYLGNTVKALLKTIEAVSVSYDSKKELQKSFIGDMDKLFKSNYALIDELDDADKEGFLIEYDIYCNISFTRCVDAYINLLAGRRNKAIKQLEKLKNKTTYEEYLIKLLKDNAPFEAEKLSEIKKNAELYNSMGVQKVDFKEFLGLFLSWIVITAVIFPIFAGIYYIFTLIEARNSVFLLGPEHCYPICFITAFVVSICLSWFTRHISYKIVNKKGYEKYKEMDEINNGDGSKRFMRYATLFLFIANLICMALCSKYNVKFKENGFVDNSKFFSLSGEYHTYDEISYVYYKPDRINDFDEIVEIPSYVIVLDDGRELDLNDFEAAEDSEDAIEYLKEKGIEIKR